jgi:hypothetical protein
MRRVILRSTCWSCCCLKLYTVICLTQTKKISQAFLWALHGTTTIKESKVDNEMRISEWVLRVYSSLTLRWTPSESDLILGILLHNSHLWSPNQPLFKSLTFIHETFNNKMTKIGRILAKLWLVNEWSEKKMQSPSMNRAPFIVLFL